VNRKLITYFSASGVTTKVAENLSKALGADLFEIKPEVPYTPKDLNWRDKTARSTIEMHDLNFRPVITDKCENIANYDTIFVGFPIWWYIAPTIINTFLESYNLSGKTIVPFATSGGSGMGETNKKLQPSCPNSILLEGKILNRASEIELIAWVESLKL
jgi:flavodoxin